MKMCGTHSQWIQQQHNSYTQGSGTTGERKQEGCKIPPQNRKFIMRLCLLEMSEDAFMLSVALERSIC